MFSQVERETLKSKTYLTKAKELLLNNPTIINKNPLSKKQSDNRILSLPKLLFQVFDFSPHVPNLKFDVTYHLQLGRWARIIPCIFYGILVKEEEL